MAESGTRSRSSTPAGDDAAGGGRDVQVGAAPDHPSGVHPERLQGQRRRRGPPGSRAARAGSGGWPGRGRSAGSPAGVPGSPGRSLAYHETTSIRRPSTSSVSEASAEVEIPCGHQRRSRRSSASHVSARCTAQPGARVRRARRFRSSSRTGSPTRPPSRSASSSISSTFSSVRTRCTPGDPGSRHRHNLGVVERQVVVGAAIVRDGRVLAARRTTPAERRRALGVPRREGRARRDRRPSRWSARSRRSSACGSASTAGWRARSRSATRYLLRVALATIEAGEPGPGRARPGPLAGRRRARRRGLAGRGPTLPVRAVPGCLPSLDG